ncbi:unnamed protein product, partial [Allacma fusca]
LIVALETTKMKEINVKKIKGQYRTVYWDSNHMPKDSKPLFGRRISKGVNRGKSAPGKIATHP